jgi:hypothetical protein
MPRQQTKDLGGLLVAIAIFNGIYERVAANVGVHPTMVSRVARMPFARNFEQFGII